MKTDTNCTRFRAAFQLPSVRWCRRIVWGLLLLSSAVGGSGSEPTAAQQLPAKGQFIRSYWYEPGIEFGNPVTNRRFRVNAPEAALDPKFAARPEVRGNGMMQVEFPESLPALAGAELYLELWGGHPGTANRRVTINGRTMYPLPNPDGEHCAHFYPTVPLKLTDLVQGHNAIQFACDQGTTFWGHFIVENAALRALLQRDDPQLDELKLGEFDVHVRAVPASNGPERMNLSLSETDFERIARVDYVGRYLDFDENGDGNTRDWHGMTKQKQPHGHLGTTTTPPFSLTWDLSMVPDQKDIQVRAVVHFRDHDELTLLSVPSEKFSTPERHGTKVELFSATDLPSPFWSRASRKMTCAIPLSIDPAKIERAELDVTLWDGGAGTVEHYFLLNGQFLPVADKGRHDVLFRRVPISATQLRRGDNRIELLSDTDHHGIEILFPGPALKVRYRK